MSRAVVAVALVFALAVVLVAVRVFAHDDEPARESECAASGIERPLPPEFPASFTLPVGTRVTDAAVSAAGSVLVRGAAPISAPEAVTLLRASASTNGWRAGPARVERGSGLSGSMRGHGRSGTWTVDEIAGCPASALVTVRFRNN